MLKREIPPPVCNPVKANATATDVNVGETKICDRVDPRNSGAQTTCEWTGEMKLAKKRRNKLGKLVDKMNKKNEKVSKELQAAKSEAENDFQIYEEKVNKSLKQDVAKLVWKLDEGCVEMLTKAHPFLASFSDGKCPMMQKNLSTMETGFNVRNCRVRRADGQGWTTELDFENEKLRKLYEDLEREYYRKKVVEQSMRHVVMDSWKETGGPATIADFVNANQATIFASELSADKTKIALNAAKKGVAEGQDIRTVGWLMAKAAQGEGKTLEEAFGAMHVGKNGFARPDSLPAKLLFEERFGKPNVADTGGAVTSRS